MSQKIYTNLDIKGNTKIGDIANATSDTDKFLVSDAGVVKYRTGSEMLSDLGVAPGVASNVQHQVKAGVAINKGQAVYVTSADGTNMIVGLASNTAEVTSSKTMGLLDNTVATNGFANVVTEGLLAGLNTIGANAGDPVWLGTNGNLIYGIANKPYAPAHLVFIGIVTRVNANNGEIFVKAQNGFELDELHDVDLKSSTPVGNQILAFEGAPVNLWKNKTISSVLGYTPYNASNPAGYISSYSETDTLSSVTGRGASTSTNVSFNGGASISTLSINGAPAWTEGTLAIGAQGVDEGGQIVLNKATSWTYAGHIDIWHDELRFLYGTNTATSGSVMSLNLATKQINFKHYTAQNAFPGTAAAYLGVDSSGNVITVAGGSGGVTSVGGTGGYGGLTLSGTVTSSGNLTLGGTPTGTWPISVSGNADTVDNLHASDFVRAYSTSNDNIDSDWGQSFKTFDPIPSGTPPIASPNLRTISIGENYSRRTQLSFDYAANRAWFRRRQDSTWSAWSEFIHSDNISSFAVPSARTITINGTSYDLSANRSWTISTSETDTLATVTGRGATTTTSLTANSFIKTGGNGAQFLMADGTTSTNPGWLISINSLLVTNALGYTPYNATNPNGYITSYTETDTLATVTGRGNVANYNIALGTNAAISGGGSAKWITTDGTASYGGGLVSSLNGAAKAYYYFDGTNAVVQGAAGVGIAFQPNNATQATLSTAGDFTANASVRAPIFFKNTNTQYWWQPEYDTSHRFQTPSGYVDIGPKNTSHCHMYTDRSSFYFNQQLDVLGNRVLNAGNYSNYAWPLEGGWKPASLASSTRLRGATSPDGGEFALAYSGGQIHPYTDGFFYQNEGQYRVIDSSSISSQSVNYANSAGSSSSASYASYLPTAYAGGQQLNPQVYFNSGIGLKVAMTAANGYWTDTVWINGYAGGDVPWMCALHTQRNSSPRMYISAQQTGSTSYGSMYEFWTNYNMDAPNKSGTSYYQTNTWMQINGAYGLYWPSNYGAHFHPNDATSYTQFRLQGSKNGYGGIYDSYSGVNGIMYDSAGNGGIYREANGRWYLYHHIGNNCTGISTSTTSSSYRAYIGGSLYAEGDIVAYSDRRKKENIVTVDSALDKVNKLRGVYYNRIDDESKRRQVGVIAQEIQEVLPEVVTYAEDIDEYGVAYGNITGILIEAIKEQQLQIEELKELVNKLIKK